MTTADMEPQEKPGVLGAESKTFTHPAFALVSASRVSGSRTLFGTDFVHHNYITLRISTAEPNRDWSHDWYSPRRELVEVALSEAQWATFVSSLNVGQGVPCTLDHDHGERKPGIPLRQQRDVHDTELTERLTRMSTTVRETMATIEGEMGASLSQKKKDAILAHLRRLDQDLTSNIPWYASVFRKHMKRVVESAKVEVNAYMHAVITKLGMERLASGEHDMPIALPAGEVETTAVPEDADL